MRSNLKIITHIIRRVIEHGWTDGWMATIGIVYKNIRFQHRCFIDRRFDRKFMINTAGRIDLENLLIQSDNKVHGVYYEPTPEKTFHKILSKLDIDHREFEFIDFGCGKGRALFLAARYPFSKITGIEFAPELVDITRQNITSFTDRRQQCRSLHVLHMDATQYEIPDSKVILYFFNPFHECLMEIIASNLKASYIRNSVKKYIIYYYPQSMHVFEKLSFLRKVASAKRLVDFSSPQFRGYTIFETVDDRIEAGRKNGVTTV